MSDPTGKDAPHLGDPTDADLGEEMAAFLINSGAAPARPDGSDAAEVEKTIETPDELGGTGGEQEGGAG